MKETEAKTENVKYYLQIAITVCIMFGFRFIPAPAPITPYGMAIIGIFLGMVYGWTITKNGLIWVALLGCLATGVTDYGTCAKVLANIFANETMGLLFLGMFLLGPIMQCDVGEWLMVKLMSSHFVKGKPWMFNILVCVGSGLVAKISSSIVVVLLLLGIFNQVFAQAGYKKGDRYPTLLTIGLFLSVLLSTAMFPFNGWGLYVTSAVQKAAQISTIDYGAYLIVSVVVYFVLMLGYVGMMFLVRCDVRAIRELDISALEEKHRHGLNKTQKVILGIVCFWVAGSIVISLAGGIEGVIGLICSRIGVYGISLITIAAFMIVRVDGKNIVTPKSIAPMVQWDTIFVMAAGMFAAGLLTNGETGVVEAINLILQPVLFGKSELVFLLLFAIVCLILSNVFNNMMVMFILASVLGSMYQGGSLTGIYTATVLLSLSTILAFYTPAASGFGAMLHSAEFVTSSSVYKWGAVTMIYILLIFVVVAIPLSNLVF